MIFFIDERQLCCVLFVRCCELGRSLLSARQMSLLADDAECSLGGYEPAYRACACVCGKGILRRDLRHTSPGETNGIFHYFFFFFRLLGPFHGAIAVPSVTRCRCRRRRRRGHRCAGGVRRDSSDTWLKQLTKRNRIRRIVM